MLAVKSKRSIKACGYWCRSFAPTPLVIRRELTLQLPRRQVVTIALVEDAGRVVPRKNRMVPAETRTLQLAHLDRLKAVVYVLRMETPEAIWTGKLLKIN